MVKISGKTKICGLIGDPVEHTISPAMQNAAFAALGLDYIYVPLRVEPPDVEMALGGARAMHLRGLNVTIPHKVAVLAFLDDIDAMAQNLGAVNTIVNNEGYLKGYNTDASGFYQALTGAGVNPAGKNVTILGAGGAARAVAFILADRGARLTILNRDEKRAASLGNSLMRLFRCDVTIGGLLKKNLQKNLAAAEIIVNTTSVGMLPQSDSSPLPSGLINPEQVVFDIIYNPLKTPLLAEAEEAGARIIGGLEMLVQQGAAAFSLWTGSPAPLDVMRKAALEELNSK
jgi:shikimate dehydrogenase